MALFSGLSSFLFGNDRVEDQNSKAQAAQAQQVAQQYRQREAQDYANQLQLGQYLQRVMSGNAPSVAGTQLQAGMDQASRAGMAQAAGGTGVNAGINNYASILNTGNVMAQTNQQAAMLRAQEQAAAAQAQAGLYGNMGARSAALGSTSGNLGLDYSQLLTQQRKADQEQQNKENAAVMQGVGAGVATLAAA